MSTVLVVGDESLAAKVSKVIDNVVLFVGGGPSISARTLELIASSMQAYECVEQMVIVIEGYAAYVLRVLPIRTPKRKEKARGTGPR